MRIRSFRTRIALLSVFSSCLVLLGFSLVAVHVMWSSKISRIDQFIKTMTQEYLNDFMPPFRQGGPMPPPPMDNWPGPPPEHHHDEFWWERRPPPNMRMQEDSLLAPIMIYTLADLDSQETLRSPNWPQAIADQDLAFSADSTVRIKTLSADGRRWRIATAANDWRKVVFGVDLESDIAVIRQVASAFLLSIPVALLLVAVGAVFMARRALRPVHELTALVERITASGLDERVNAPVKDAEFENLILVFNQMMDRLERSFMQATRFGTDAAHELRTPISILQGYLERMLCNVEPASQMQQDLSEMLDEIHRIKSTLEKLLLLARMDAGQVQLHMQPLDLSSLLTGIVEDIQALAPHLNVQTDIEPGVMVDADMHLLETAIQNLGSNAIKYNLTKDGRIDIRLTKKQDKTVHLSVDNTGPKISEKDRDRIFERFYRSDKSRSRDIDGLGLGLSLAREIMQAHHGRLGCVQLDGGVNRFEINMPAADQ